MAGRPLKKRDPKAVKFQQIITAPFSTETGSSYSVLGLSTTGRVYRFDPKCDAWIPWSNKVATCKKAHKAGR